MGVPPQDPPLTALESWARERYGMRWPLRARVLKFINSYRERSGEPRPFVGRAALMRVLDQWLLKGQERLLLLSAQGPSLLTYDLWVNLLHQVRLDRSQLLWVIDDLAAYAVQLTGRTEEAAEIASAIHDVCEWFPYPRLSRKAGHDIQGQPSRRSNPGAADRYGERWPSSAAARRDPHSPLPAMVRSSSSA